MRDARNMPGCGGGLLTIALVLAVPIVPFLLVGSQLEGWLGRLVEDPLSDAAAAWLVIGLLSTDILLPIPSSVVSTLSGSQLGWWRGTWVTWLGMTIGATLGFAIARRWGQPLARRLSKSEDLDRVHQANARYGPVVLVLTRAIPVFAEAAVLLAGVHQLAWRQFLPAVLLSNLGIAVAYAVFGDLAGQHQWLPLALGIAVAAPAGVVVVVKRYWPTA